ncbi:MAG: methylenetetrahydrofolate reductase [NAD(P)H] [Deltaproteobacteria bacterium]|nr:methylenetetrahydrofolate reductase [NAD(P)H] [Deltaproteobacteria bacterium]
MKIKEFFTSKKTTLSFEVFPPGKEDEPENFFDDISDLCRLKPQFISVTYGAGGGNRDKSLETANRIKNGLGSEVLAHFTCVAATKDDIAANLDAFLDKNIENILALRGDPPAGLDKFKAAAGGFSHANELVAFIKSLESFCIAVAGYPEGHIEAPDLQTDIVNLKRKVDAGADFVITQLFFDNDDFYRFRERAKKAGIGVPVVAGLWPILNYRQTERIVTLCGAKVPSSLGNRIERFRDKPEDMEKCGIEFAIRQAEDLIRNEVSGIHLYSMNRSDPMRQILLELPIAT